jgi:iron complex transport system substrate-binding protein
MKNLFLILASALLLASCSNTENNPADKKGQRVISLSKQLTEIIFAIGGDSILVGTDLSSNFPEEAKKLPKVGYHRALSAEGIISLHPTEVWHDGNIAPDAVIEQVKKVGIPFRQFSGGNTIDSTKLLITQIASLFHNEKKAEQINQKLDDDMKKAEEEKAKYTDHPRVLIIHFGQAANKYFVLSNQGVPQQMLAWAGAVNATDTAQKWRDLSAEVIAQCQPDVILATDYGYDLQGSLDKFKQLPGIALSPAAKNNRIYRIEERDLVYLGPRTGENVLKIIQLVHRK